MTTVDKSTEILVAQATSGDETALAELFSLYKTQLRRMIAFRMDGRLKGRVDPSDILQEAYFDLAQRLPEFGQKEMSFFVWLRLVAKERLLKVHRQHIETQKRDARREVALPQDNATTSLSLAAQLLGRFTSVVDKAIRAERSARLHAVLDSMDQNDREIIALRVFEGLTNGETAEVLGLTKQAASKRFLRAICRIREELKELPGFEPH